MSTLVEMTAGEVMTQRFLTAEPDDTIGELAEKMAAHDVASAVVVEHGHLIGVLTSRDVVRAVAARAHPSDARVREFMSTPAVVARVETPADEAARMMVEGHFHHLPVVDDDGRPLGVVGFRSVQGALAALGSGF